MLCYTITRRTGTNYSKQIQRIRWREFGCRQLRRLIVPGFVSYGLFVVRPHEGHFVRYLAERRYCEPEFHRMFPPTAHPTNPAEGTCYKDTESSKGQWWYFPFFIGSVAGKCPVKAAGDEDAERIARRRLLFEPRRGTHVESDVINAFPPLDTEHLEQQSMRSECGRPHMREICSQLWELQEASKSYKDAFAAGMNTPTPSVRLEFHDWFLFATASVVFTESLNGVVKRLRFIGICGMIWYEV
ncbi:hypothetical protein ERJ75_001006500 [Trypanosoma vivax]|uniref:Uncharacterized protein n=1 Tax=Trypanosoma vivax (strain Y486) TaxID=1055687 RepID=G0TYJ5_TRYVY|nr:hypothetical protein TRVL_02221 [Trypanosoma vivax]KAH8611285.1 hypothetical protein ERJ75_001006500 [Trypanosoma vivax]CCC49042.1 conserved hypothetical protein [Trypanosoma vivax Y486]